MNNIYRNKLFRVYWNELKYRIKDSKNEGIIWEVERLLFYQYYNVFKCCISIYSSNLFGMLLECLKF